MNKKNKELFARLKAKAHLWDIPYEDEKLDGLADLVNEAEHKTLSLGVKRSEAGYTSSDYVFLEWEGQALIAVKTPLFENPPNYIIYDFKTNSKGDAIDFQGVYSTISSKYAGGSTRFQGKMSPASMEGKDTPKGQEFLDALFTEALNAKYEGRANR